MTATAMDGVWSVNVPVEADAITFHNGAAVLGETDKIETVIPAEGDLYAQGSWQYSYAFVAPLAETGTFTVTTSGQGSVYIDGTPASGSAAYDVGTHAITVAPDFDNGYYIKSLSIGGTPVNLDNQSFSNGAVTVSHTLAANANVEIIAEFAVYAPVAGKTGIYSVSINYYNRETRWENLEEKVLQTLFGDDYASSGYTLMLNASQYVGGPAAYQSFSDLYSKEGLGQLIGAIPMDIGDHEQFSIAFTGSDRYPAFNTIEDVKILIKESRPTPVIRCTDEDRVIEMLERNAPTSNYRWQTWAKNYLAVTYGSDTTITNYSVDVDYPVPYPEVGASADCTLTVSVSGTREYAAATDTIVLKIVNGFLADINVTQPEGASIKIYKDAACTTELTELIGVLPGTYYVKITASEGYKVTDLTGVTGAAGNDASYTGTLTVEVGATEAITYNIGGSTEKLSYTITFDADGGSAIDAITQNYGTAITAPAAPTKTGYTFAGWSPALPTTMPAENLTVTAQWKVNQYTITFADTGDSTIAPITQDYGTAITAPAAPTKTGYTFDGWDVEIPTTMPAEDLTVTAQWKVNEYTVTWDVDGETKSETYDYGEAIVKPVDPTKDEFTFAGWKNVTDDNNTVPATMPAKNLEFTAIWTADKVVTWNVDGTKTTRTYKTGETIVKPDDPSKEGYTFTGWQDYTDGMTMGETSLEFVAQWKINQYTITFANTGDSTIAPITQDYGAAITAPADPSKTGYTFTGWDVEIPATMPAENLTVKAQWKINQYTLSFDTDGGSTIADITADYGADITAPEAPTKTGYAFAGWVDAEGSHAEVPATMPLNGLNLKATWVPDTNDNSVNDAEETATIFVTVTGPDKGSVTLSGTDRTDIIDHKDGSYTVLFDSKTVGGNVITVNAKPFDTNGADGSADYVESLSHESVTVANGGSYNVTAAFATRSIGDKDSGSITLNRFKADRALTKDAYANEIMDGLYAKVIEALDLSDAENYLLSAQVTVSYEGHSIDLEVAIDKDGVKLEDELPADVEPKNLMAYGLKDLTGLNVLVQLPAKDNLPEVSKGAFITIEEERSAAEITVAQETITVAFDKVAEVEAAAAANVSAAHNGKDIGIDSLVADEPAKELMDADKKQTITYTATVEETVDYLGDTATFTVVATHKTYPPIINVTENHDYGDAVCAREGETATVTVTPNEGCYVESVLCNGETLSGSYAAGGIYTADFTAAIGDNVAYTYNVVVTYGKRSIALKSPIASVTYTSNKDDLLEAVYEAMVDETASLGGIAYEKKVSVSGGEAVTGAGTYSFTVTWADDSVANKYPTLSATADVQITNALVLNPETSQTLTAPVIDGKIELSDEQLLAAVHPGTLPEDANVQKVIVGSSAEAVNAALQLQGDSIAVQVKITAGGEGTPYDPAEALVTLTVKAPVNKPVITVKPYENGTVALNGVNTAAGTKEYEPGQYNVTLSAEEPYVANVLKISAAGLAEQEYIGVTEPVSFFAMDSSGWPLDYVPTYIVTATFAIPAVSIPAEADMNYYVGMESSPENLEALAMAALEAGEGGVVYTPGDLKDGSGEITYRAREKKTYIYTAVINPADFGLGFVAAQTVEVPIEAEELWLGLGEEFTMPAEPSNEQIKAIVDQIVEKHGVDKLMDMFENDRAALEALLKEAVLADPAFADYYSFYGAHRFGDNVDNTELVKLTVTGEKYGEVESNISKLTLSDTRIDTSIALASGVEMVYGFSEAELLAALGGKVSGADGADLGIARFLTDVSGLGASKEPIPVKMAYDGNASYKSCVAEVTITVKPAAVDLHVDNRFIRWEEGLRYALPVTTDPAGVDTLTFIAGINISNANIDSGAIGSGNPVVGLRGDIILLVPEALQSALGYVGIELGSTMTVAELKTALLELVELSGISVSGGESVEKLVKMLDSLSDKAGNAKVYVGGELPTDIGLYVVGAVTADANYETDFGAGLLVIHPEAMRAELAWKYDLESSLVQKELLTELPDYLDAVVTKVYEGDMAAAQAETVELFFGVDASGEIVMTGNAAGLGLGAYLEVGAISNFGNTFYYAKPIMRPVLLVEETIQVEIIDENGKPNRDRFFTYDGKSHGVDVRVTAEDGTVLVDTSKGQTSENLKVAYVGLQSNGKPWLETSEPTRSGLYTVLAVYAEKENGEVTLFGADAGAMEIEPADSSVEANSKSHKYDGNTVSTADMVKGISAVPGEVPTMTVITAAINAGSTENAFAAVKGVVNVDFPAWLDEYIRKIPGSDAAYTADGVDLSAFYQYADELEKLLELAGIETEIISRLVETLGKLPEGTHLSFLEQSQVAPYEVGNYLVVGIVTDPDHHPSMNAALLVIYNELTEAELKWKYVDENNVFMLSTLTNKLVDLAADAYVDGAVDPKLNPGELYLGVDTVNWDIVLCDDQTELRGGVYTEIAYLLDLKNGSYYAEPILRVFMVVEGDCVLFYDENGEINHGRVFDYDGSPKEIGRAYVYGDDKGFFAEDLPEGDTLEIQYIGSDLTGDGWMRTEAPTDAGVYMVVATYTDNENGEAVGTGRGIGFMVIRPAELALDMKDTTVTYDGEGHFVDVTSAVENPDYLTVIVDDQTKTVNIILEDDTTVLGAKAKEILEEELGRELDGEFTVGAVKTALKDAIAKLEAKVESMELPEKLQAAIDKLPTAAKIALKRAWIEIKGAELPSEAEKLVEYLPEDLQKALKELDELSYAGVKAEIEALLQKLEEKFPNETVITFNGDLPVDAGEYEFYGFSVSKNYAPEATEGVLTIEPAEVTVTLDDVNLNVGDALPEEYTYTVDGLVGEDTLEVTPSCDVADTSAEGTYTITATYVADPNYTVTVEDGTLTVSAVPAESVEAAEESVELEVGESESVTVTVGPENATDKTITAESADESVAKVTVDENGNVVIEAVGPGTTTVTVTNSAGQTDTIKVTVTQPATSIETGKDKVELDVGESETVTVTVGPENATDKTVTAKSAEESVAKVTVDENGNVVIEAVGPGTTTVTVTNSAGQTDTIEVTVKQPAESIEAGKDKVELKEGESETVTVTVGPENASDKTITAKSVDESIAKVTVDENGNVVIEAVGPGTTTVTVTNSAGQTDTIEVTVKPKREGYPIDLSGNNLGVKPGDTVEVDGITYEVDEDCLVWVDKTTHKIVVSYKFKSSTDTIEPKYNGGNGPHYIYPSNMYVWYLSYSEQNGYDAQRVEKLDNFLNDNRSSIRMSGNQGIRIFTAVPSDRRSALINGSLVTSGALKGYKLIEYGTLFSLVEKGDSLTLANGARSYAYSTAQGRDAIFSRQGNDIWYTGMLVDLQPDLCDDELLLRPYMILQGPSGEKITIYGGTLQRTIGYVALQNRDYKPTAAAHKFIWDIIYNVYGKGFKYPQ